MFKFRMIKGTELLEEVKKLVLKLVYFLMGLVLSQGIILNGNPFGVAISIAAPKAYSVPAIIGAATGYLFLPKLSRGIGYISIILMIAAIRWILNGFDWIHRHVLFLPVVSFISSFMIEIFINYSQEPGLWYIYMTLMDAFMIAISTYFFVTFFQCFTDLEYGINKESKFIQVCISLFAMIVSLSSVTFYKLSIGRILSVVIIVFAAYCGGIYGGSVVGTAIGTAVEVLSMGRLYISGMYAFAGMASGICANGNRIKACGAFLICSAVFLFNSAVPSNILTVSIYEIIAGLVIFMFIPRKAIDYIKKLFSVPKKSYIKREQEGKNSEKKYISETIKSISNAAEDAVHVAFSEAKPEIKSVCMDSAVQVCSNCNLKSLCWERNKDSTKAAFEETILSIIETPRENNSEYEISKKCKNSSQVIEKIRKSIYNYENGIEAKIRAKEIFSGISEKFSFAEAILGYANERTKINDNLDLVKSTKIKSLLLDYKIDTVRTECKINKMDKLFVEIEVMKIENRELITQEILDRISSICQKAMSTPMIFDVENRILIRISEKENFAPKVCVGRHNCNDGEFCGDYCSCFKDGAGKFFAIISDGMGSGGRAAADGAVTAGIIERLIKLRVDPISALKIANLSISGKASEESLTAVDIMVLDLYSGEAEIVKTGAPITIIRRGNEIDKIEEASLPIGIFDEINMSVNKFRLSEGDVVIMMSDGITDIGTDWIEDRLKNLEKVEGKDLTNYIIKETISQRSMNHDDDATVAIISIFKN